MKAIANIFMHFFLFDAVLAGPTRSPVTYDSETYDVGLEDLDILYDYDENLSVDQAQVEIGTVVPSVTREIYLPSPLPEEPEEEASTPKLIDGSSPHGPGVLGPHTHEGLPTCLLCMCLSTSVYCDDRELEDLPPLPKETTHFYSRYNRIKRVNRDDFANLSNLKRIDLTSNFISEIDEDAFRKLPQLQELILRDNKIRQLPELPPTLIFIDISNNRLGRKGIKQEAFKDMFDLHHLYITDNNLDHIPLPLPESLQSLHLQNNNIQEMHEDTFCKMKDYSYIRKSLEDIRLDGNPINLSKTPHAYMCLPRLPVGSLF
ncbi:epiphycan [Podarcis raffonei]|uniref:epiphycan n=1 Tax=Podarcis raffonei TaxID=65483 RepID=UPI0023297EF4|nr:epiphycan [Podarcis raffonei]XP_053262827.1 epiphycan [Podarcis raffonei]